MHSISTSACFRRLFLDVFRKALITPVADFGVKKILLMAVIFQPRFVSSCDDLGGAFIGNPFGTSERPEL